MSRSTAVRIFLSVSLSAVPSLLPFAAAETIELVTYYPAPGGGNVDADRLHARRATIGNPYSLTNPADANLPNGTLLVAGPVAIGTANPLGQLHVRSEAGQGALFLSGASDAGQTWSALYLDDVQTGDDANRWTVEFRNQAGTPQENALQFVYWTGPQTVVVPLTIQPGGNVGVRTADPTRPLHVVANVVPLAGPPPFWAGQIFVEPGADNEATGISLRSTYTAADVVWSIIAGSGGATPNTNFRIYNSTAALDRLNITPGGNVGVGVVAPRTTSPINNIAAGNLDVNDLFLRSANRWAGQVPRVTQVSPAANATYAGTETVLMQVTINARGGPVLVQARVNLQTPGTASNNWIILRRAGLNVDARVEWSNLPAGVNQTATVMAAETLPAGSHTYQVIGVADATWTAQAAYSKLTVIEY